MTNRLILSPILMRPTLIQLQVAGNEQLRQARCPGRTGARVIARKNGQRVRLYSRPGNDFTHRFSADR
jgi:hypothetical protein